MVAELKWERVSERGDIDRLPHCVVNFVRIAYSACTRSVCVCVLVVRLGNAFDLSIAEPENPLSLCLYWDTRLQT